MKKLYILALFAFAISSVNAQTYLAKDFDDNSATSGGWTINEPTPATTSSLTWTTSTAGGAPNAYGMMKNYNGTGNEAVESWLISPSVDLSTSTTPLLSFKSAVAYDGDALEVLVSINYDGTSDPSSQGSWSALNPAMPLNSGTWFEWVSSGNVDLSAYNTAGVYIAFKYTGTATDGSTWEVDDILVNETGAVIPPSKSIYDIQYSVAGNGDSPENGNTVISGGIVTGVKSNGSYFIQNGSGPWTGIYVYDLNNTVAIGDSVTFTCVVTEFSGLTELTNITGFNNASSGNTVVKTIVTTGAALAEMYEGVLVNVPVTNCTVATNGFGEWTINDGSGDCIVDDFLLGTTYNAVVGGPYDVTGIIDYAFGSFLMQPRTLADIITSVGINEIATLQTSIYPNPANEFLNVEAPANSNVTIISIAGKNVMNTTTNNAVEMIDVSSLESGSYIVSISNSNAFSTQILIKK